MHRWIAALAVVFAIAPHAASATAWGSLEPGPHAVGFQLLDRFDATRPYWMARDLDGKPRAGERARPMRISVWYPAQPSQKPLLTVGDYVAMMGAEDRVVPIGETEREAGRRAFYAFQFLRAATPEQRARLESLTSRARRDAPPANGKFPVILYSLGSPALAHVTPEYLASHGYVVMQMPRLGRFAGMPQDAPDDTESKVRDTEFLLQAARELPFADTATLAAIGFSAGGRWALLAGMRNPDVRAIVSLDSVMLFNDAAARDWRTLRSFDRDALRIPVLHMIRREWVPQEDASLWEGLRYADRTMMIFEDPLLDHFDFQSSGYASTLAGLRPRAARSSESVFQSFHQYTLAFLNAHVKNDAAARAFLARTPEENGARGVTLTRIAAAPAPPALADVMNAVAEGKVDAALRTWRAAIAAGRAAEVPEAVVNLAGYNLLGAGRVDDAIAVFQLNADAHPRSANVYDSLADAYAAAGDRAKAAELARKALALLDADTTITAERRELIRQSARQKLPARGK